MEKSAPRDDDEKEKRKENTRALLTLSSSSSYRRRHPRAPERHADVGGEPDDGFARGDVPGGDRAPQGAAAASFFASSSSPLLVGLVLPCRGRFGAGRGTDDEADADIGMAARGADPVDESGVGQVPVIAGALFLLLGGRDREVKDQQQQKKGGKGPMVNTSPSSDRHRSDERLVSASTKERCGLFALAFSDGADERDARDFQLREVEQKKGASSSAKGREKRTRKKIT